MYERIIRESLFSRKNLFRNVDGTKITRIPVENSFQDIGLFIILRQTIPQIQFDYVLSAE
jgi:hypothetical protein